MSERAYRLIEIKKEDSPSFDLHDQDLMDFMDKEDGLYSHLNSWGTGIVEASIKTLEKAVEMAVELHLDEDTVDQLKKDIAAAKSSQDEYVTYYCC